MSYGTQIDHSISYRLLNEEGVPFLPLTEEDAKTIPPADPPKLTVGRTIQVGSFYNRGENPLPGSEPARRDSSPGQGRTTFGSARPVDQENIDAHRRLIEFQVFKLKDGTESHLFTTKLWTNRQGLILPTCLWPQIGLDKLVGKKSVKDVRGELFGTYAVKVANCSASAGDDVRELATLKFIILQEANFPRPVIYHSNEVGDLYNGFRLRESPLSTSDSGAQAQSDLFVSILGREPTGKGKREGEDHAAAVRIYLVDHRSMWKRGDTFTPVTLLSRREAVMDFRLPNDNDPGEPISIQFANYWEIMPGVFDIIVVWEPDEESEKIPLTIRLGDSITRCVPGLIVCPSPETLTAIKVGTHDDKEPKNNQGGVSPEKSQDSSEPPIVPEKFLYRKIAHPPYFTQSTAYETNENIFAALSPLAPPSVAAANGNENPIMVDFHIAEHDLKRSKGSDLSPATISVRAQAQTGATGPILLWEDIRENDFYEYDIIARYREEQQSSEKPAGASAENTAAGKAGEKAGEATAQETEKPTFDPGDCSICGYINRGLHIVKDPTTFESYERIGRYRYSEQTKAFTDIVGGAAGKSGRKFDLDVEVRGSVGFPAKVWRTTDPMDVRGVSNGKMPLVVIAHGDRTLTNVVTQFDYLGFDYLIDRIASLGIIAASVYLDEGLGPEGCAVVINEHINVLRKHFRHIKIDRIGLVGHSRSGLGVTTFARFNLGGEFRDWNGKPQVHNIRSILTLAPIDRIAAHEEKKPGFRLMSLEKKLFKPEENLKDDVKTAIRDAVDNGYIVPILLSIFGSLDGSLAAKRDSRKNEGGTSLALFDRVSASSKAMVYIEGGIHNRFNRELSIDEVNALLKVEDRSSMLSADGHETITEAFASALFVPTLRDSWASRVENQERKGKLRHWLGSLMGDWVPPGVQALNCESPITHIQYHAPVTRRQLIADFEIEPTQEPKAKDAKPKRFQDFKNLKDLLSFMDTLDIDTLTAFMNTNASEKPVETESATDSSDPPPAEDSANDESTDPQVGSKRRPIASQDNDFPSKSPRKGRGKKKRPKIVTKNWPDRPWMWTEGSISVPQVSDLKELDPFSPHFSRGLLVKWHHNPTILDRMPKVHFEHPETTTKAEKQERSVWELENLWSEGLLSFRVAQRFDSELNPPGRDQDFYIYLTDSDRKMRGVRVGCFATISPTSERAVRKLIKSSMISVRIPLSVFFDSSEPPAESALGFSIRRVTFEFSATVSGELLFDDIEFVEPTNKVADWEETLADTIKNDPSLPKWLRDSYLGQNPADTALVFPRKIGQ